MFRLYLYARVRFLCMFAHEKIGRLHLAEALSYRALAEDQRRAA